MRQAGQAGRKVQREHDERAGALEAETTAIEKRIEAGETRWAGAKEELTVALRRARGSEITRLGQAN